MRRNSGAYTSPGTPEYGDHLPKTWSSERATTTRSTSRRHFTAAALMPLSSGRSVPSKWDDAERWITSPISSGYGPFNTAAAHPKSKSGPLAPTGLVYLPNYSSPTLSLSVKDFMANSPLSTGVLVSSVHYEVGIATRSKETHITTNTPDLSDMLNETSQDADGYSRVLRKDMATQMSPEGSTHSSSKGRLSFSTLRSTVPSYARQHTNPAAPSGKDDVRDVQIDKGTNSSSHGSRKQEMEVGDVPAAWNVSDSSNNMSKLQREEAEITAWENLQRAKAEAAVRKLEMKLEKKRSASMDKITNKLRAAQMKAQAMKNSLSSDTDQPSTSSKRKSCSLFLKICSICNCCLCTKR